MLGLLPGNNHPISRKFCLEIRFAFHDSSVDFMSNIVEIVISMRKTNYLFMYYAQKQRENIIINALL